MRNATKAGIAELRSATEQRIVQIEVKMEKMKTGTVRWMFMFWVDQIGVLVAIPALFFQDYELNKHLSAIRLNSIKNFSLFSLTQLSRFFRYKMV